MERKQCSMEIEMFNQVYKNKKVLITGHSGFKGTWLSIWLKLLGANLYGISKEVLTNPSFYEISSHKQNFKEEYFFNISDYDTLNKTIKKIKPDFIFHLAAQSLVSVSYENPLETINSNVIGTANLLEVLRNLDEDCVAVLITSDKVYKNVEKSSGYEEGDTIGGHDIYSGSKGAADTLIHSYYKTYFSSNSKVKIVSARAGNVIGGGDWSKDRLIVDCIKSWVSNKKVSLRSPNATRPWQHVIEPLSGYLLLGSYAFKSKCLGEPFNFGPDSKSVITVLELIKKLSNKWFKDDNIDFFSIQKSELKEANLLQLDCHKAYNELGWKSIIETEDLVDLTINWYKSFYNKEDVEELSIKQILYYQELGIKNNLQWVR